VARLTLSRQLLLLQTLIVVLVVTVVAGVSLVQTDADFRSDESRRMRGTAESVASEGLVRAAAAQATDPQRRAALEDALWARLERIRASADASYLLVLDAEGVPLSAPVHPGSADDTTLRDDVRGGATWAGTGRRFGERTIEAQAAVFGDGQRDQEGRLVGGGPGELLGYVVVGRYYPSRLEVIGTAAPSVFLYLALAGAIGVAGSLLLARRVKRQTLGLEPPEIAALVEQREAMLHGVREGVVGVDMGGTVAFANDEAAELLALDGDVIGRGVDELGVPPEVAAVLRGGATGRDRVVAAGQRLLVLNGRPVLVRGRQTGWVTSMRDRTQLLELQQELADAEAGTDTLRAQVHEFRNRLHAMAGMAELGRYDDLRDFVQEVISRLDGRMAAVSGSVEDPAVAALLVAKASRADELGIEFAVSEGSRLHQHGPALSADLVTVVGNLVDNAFDAVPRGQGRVAVDLRDDGERIVVQVRDTGAGFGEEELAHVFEMGWTTKNDGAGHGFGLALTRMACRRHGGDVSIEYDDGAVLRAELSAGEAMTGV
jgi:two-component system CitB family sensor kinase